MTERTLRLIRDDGGLHPWLNMALDLALEPEPPVLRLYAWDPPGLSLGYFQPAADFPREVLDRHGLVLVRRVTGGAAICHQDDLTFSLVARPGFAPFTAAVQTSYDRVHGAIAAGLARLGVDARAAGEALRPGAGRAGEPVCFHAPTSFDLLAGGRKLVGSAQRRTRERIVHHGSIPIGPNPLATGAACLQDVLRRRPSFAEVADAVAAGFAGAFDLDLVERPVTPAERQRADELVAARFSTDAWNLRR